MFEEPYVGMPIKLGNMCDVPSNNMACEKHLGNVALDDLPLAMSYVPFQKWTKTYALDKALQRGTLFPELDLPFKGGMCK